MKNSHQTASPLFLSAKKGFEEIFGRAADVQSFAPGRAEIIGNHTDYNMGYALAAALERGIICAAGCKASAAGAASVRVYSTNFANDKVIDFEASDRVEPSSVRGHWSNYIRGVTQYLVEHGAKLGSVDLFITSDLPLSGGVASSAALQIACMLALAHCCGFIFPGPLELALACQEVENKYVQSPCGILDQGTIAFGKARHLVLFDFLPQAKLPVGSVRTIDSELLGDENCFVIALDPGVKRQLSSSGYPARRKSCEDSLLPLGHLLGRQLSSLRDVSSEEFEGVVRKLSTNNPEIARRVQHIVTENDRVLAAVKAMRAGDSIRFGELLTESGISALDFYDLAENTPELRLLVETGRNINGVLGFRNMGGGFSANTIGYVRRAALESFKSELQSAYSKQFSGKLQFLEFTPSPGASLIS